jgi:hypothetical protein
MSTKATPAVKPAAKPAVVAAKPPAGKAVKAAAKPTIPTAVRPKTAISAPEASDAPVAHIPKLAPPKFKAPPPTEDDDKTAKGGKKRQQLTSVLHIDISQARCMTHLKNNLANKEIEAEVKALRAELKALKEPQKPLREAMKKSEEAGDVAEVTRLRGEIERMQAELAAQPRFVDLKKKIADLSQKQTRIGGEAPIATAVIADYVVKEMLCYAMDNALESDRKLVEVAHIHGDNFTQISTWPLLRNLPSIVSYSPEEEARRKEERAASNKAAKEAREAKKAAAGKGVKAAEEKEAAPEAAAEGDAEHAEHAEHAHGGKTTFLTYVENLLQTVKSNERYATMRVSNRVREYCADIIAELMTRLTRLCNVEVKDINVVRTLTAAHVKGIMTLIMVDEHRTPEQIDAIRECIDEKLKIYSSHTDGEKAKKLAEMPAEKKAALERKKAEEDIARKQKQAEGAEKRAKIASDKAHALRAELADPSLAAPAAESAEDILGL